MKEIARMAVMVRLLRIGFLVMLICLLGLSVLRNKNPIAGSVPFFIDTRFGCNKREPQGIKARQGRHLVAPSREKIMRR